MNLSLLQEIQRLESPVNLEHSPPDAQILSLPADIPDLTAFPNSDTGNAERFHAIHGTNIRYVGESGQWLLWDGIRWQADTTGAITRRYVQVMRLMSQQSIVLADINAAQTAARYGLRSTNRAQIESALSLTHTIEGVSVGVSDLDADPWLVGVINGVVDLRLGQPIAPLREHLITKSIGSEFDPSARCPTWEKFLNTVTNGDQELIDFLQAAVGYTLTGSSREQCLFFLYGTGQNGKGVFSEVIKRLIGDYGLTAPESLFTKDKNTAATNDIARLAGARMAIAAELDEGAAFAESRIKSLTGGDTITARYLHKEFFDFHPTHKFWISGNHKPSIKGSDFGIWRRIRLIPFVVRIPDEEKDPDLVSKLVEELPGILNWAIAGCQKWLKDGLPIPQCVKNATEEYRSEEDVIGRFLSENTAENRSQRTLTKTLYQAYERWAEAEGIRYPITNVKFTRKVEGHGLEKIKSGGVWHWENLELLDS